VTASKAELNSISAEVTAELLEDLNNDLKDSAASAGWPKSVVSNLSVKSMMGSIFIDYPDTAADEILDLEYGTTTTQPSAVLRKFKDRNAQKIAKLTVDAYADWLTKTGGGVF
jgi:hypothetical protein